DIASFQDGRNNSPPGPSISRSDQSFSRLNAENLIDFSPSMRFRGRGGGMNRLHTEGRALWVSAANDTVDRLNQRMQLLLGNLLGIAQRPHLRGGFFLRVHQRAVRVHQRGGRVYQPALRVY